jgi:hypothetical protein
VETRHHLMTCRILQQPTDPLIPLLIGDVVHTMRQGLDHLAYRLAIIVRKADPPPNEESTMWPIRTKAKLSGAVANDIGPKKHMPPGMYAAIEGFQTDAGQDGALMALLTDLDRLDKHRFLPIVTGLLANLDLTGTTVTGGIRVGSPRGHQIHATEGISGEGVIQLGDLRDGDIIIESENEVDVEVRPTTSIAFDPSYNVAPGELVLPLLEAIHDAISDRLFPAMEQFL